MKLTLKDKEFLERLKPLYEDGELRVELKQEGIKRLVLRQNYGSRIETIFRLSRQGVRWRFQRLFNEIYVSAYETILSIESAFGTGQRSQAIEIAQEKANLRRKANQAQRLAWPSRGEEDPQHKD